MRWLHFQTEMCHQRGGKPPGQKQEETSSLLIFKEDPLDKIALETWLDTGMVGMREGSKHCWM